MKTRVFGVYDTTLPAATVAARKAAIIRCCAEAKLPVPHFDAPSFLDATVLACESETRVWLVGSLHDLHAPAIEGTHERGFSDEEWREGWLAYLSEESLIWLSIDGASQVETSSLSKSSVIRSYRRAWQALMRILARARSRRSKNLRSTEPRYTSGRPPYGYRAKNGCLEHHSTQRLARVRKVYELIRRRETISSVAKAMRQDERGKHWDTVKVRRLLFHAPLYCLGEYRSGKLTKRAPELAFLPADWVDTAPHQKEAVLKGPGAVSRRPGSGKLKASASSPH